MRPLPQQAILEDNTVEAFGSDQWLLVSGKPADLGPVKALYTTSFASLAWTEDDRIITWGKDGDMNPINGGADTMANLTTPAGLGGVGLHQL